jgi:hypothetical protein
VLAGTNTYTGVTSLQGGVLSVSLLADGGAASNIGAAGSAAANLELRGGTLRYTGAGASTDRLFALGVAAGSRLESAGTGTLVFGNPGAIAFTGSGARTLTLAGSGAGLAPDGGDPFWSQARSWTIIDNTGAGSSSGTFASIDQTIWAAGTFGVVYGTGAGGDVTLEWTPTVVPVPEPALSAALSVASAAVLALTAVRRRARAGRRRSAG